MKNSFEGSVRKMRTELNNGYVSYYLPIGSNEVYMNELIGSEIKIEYTNDIHCIKCGEKTYKSFAQGFCYRCLTTAPEAEECVLKPELCRAHEGIARDMEYAQENCLCPQIVYLAVSNNVKVGVTRHFQVPTRWIDQGATYALAIAQVPNRYTAGIIEMELKKYFTDKTNWQQMLKNNILANVDLPAERRKAFSYLPQTFQQYQIMDGAVLEIKYPVESYPTKIKSLDIEKQLVITQTLTGIKGQYLLFADGNVTNIRKYGGYSFRLHY
ncbi:MAG: DUF2797 domain-containing protein [Bacteroidales bacterium]|nr:DUF2797 domain-containing protein [Bacteroidales bacterium]